jgi:hypothetical protein
MAEALLMGIEIVPTFIEGTVPAFNNESDPLITPSLRPDPEVAHKLVYHVTVIQ